MLRSNVRPVQQSKSLFLPRTMFRVLILFGGQITLQLLNAATFSAVFKGKDEKSRTADFVSIGIISNRSELALPELSRSSLITKVRRGGKEQSSLPLRIQ